MRVYPLNLIADLPFSTCSLPYQDHQYGEGQLRNPEPQLSYALCLSVFQHAFVGLGLQIVRGKDARVVRARRNFHDAAKSVCSPSRTVVGGD